MPQSTMSAVFVEPVHPQSPGAWTTATRCYRQLVSLGLQSVETQNAAVRLIGQTVAAPWAKAPHNVA